MSVDVLLFDLGGVLVDFAGLERLRELTPGSPDLATVRARWIASPLVAAFESGRLGADELARRLVAKWPLPLAPAALEEEMRGWIRGLYPGAAELLVELRRRYRLACLSNTHALHVDLNRAWLAPYLDRLFFSNEIGLTKPDPEIFRFVARELDVPTERIAFFDDTEANVEAAAGVGMQAFRVEGPDGIRAALQTLEGEPDKPFDGEAYAGIRR